MISSTFNTVEIFKGFFILKVNSYFVLVNKGWFDIYCMSDIIVHFTTNEK